MTGTTGFVTALVINLAIATVAVALFVLWRPKYPWCFDTRRNPQRRIIGTEPPAVPPGKTTWLTRALRMTDSEVLDTAGLDALMFCKFLEVCAQLFCLLSIFGIGILLPVNFTASASVEESFDEMSMAKVPESSDRFWAHLILAYVFCFVFFYLVYHTWQDYLNLRHQFLARWLSLGGGHTVLVHNLPAEIRHDAALFAYFSKVFPGEVRGARMAKDFRMEVAGANELKSLNENVEARASVEAELENNIATWEATLNNKEMPSEKKTRPMKATKCFCCAKVDAIDHNAAELDRLNAIVEEKRREMMRPDAPVLKSGFVTFYSAKAAVAAQEFVYDTHPFSFEVKLAPECRDVYWPNMNMDYKERSMRWLIFLICTILLTAFWAIPMGFLQGLSNLRRLGNQYSWLSGVDVIPDVILGFIEAYLPAIMLSVFFSLVPTILLYFARQQGIEAGSWQQKSMMKAYFAFMILNFFFVPIIGTSLLDQAKTLFSDVSSVPTILGQTIPVAANQFTTYVALQAFAGFPVQMAQFGRLIGGGVKKKYLAKTPREFEAAEAPPELTYGAEYPKHLFVFLVAITYSIIAPIIIPFAACYFVIGWIVMKYQLVHVFVQHFESGGSFWPSVYSMMSTCLLISQLCLVGILGLKKVPAEAVLVIPLPIITVLFDRYIHSAVKTKLVSLPLEQLVEIDARHKEARLAKGADAKSATLPAAPSDAAGAQNEFARHEHSFSRVVIHAEPSEVREEENHGNTLTTDTYPITDNLAVDRTTLSIENRAAVGFPYTPADQNRAYVEGDVAAYIQPELTPLVPDRLEVNRAEQYRTDATGEPRTDENRPLGNPAASSDQPASYQTQDRV